MWRVRVNARAAADDWPSKLRRDNCEACEARCAHVIASRTDIGL